MSVNLSVIFHATGAKTERIDRPIQIGGPVGLSQRKPFTDGRLINLDGRDPHSFQADNFVTDGQGDLAGRDFSRLIVADE